MKNFKTLAVIVLLCGLGLMHAQAKLNMFIDYNRFLDAEGRTVLHIDYQIPHRNLVFLAHKGGFFAEVDVVVDVLRSDSLMFRRTVADNIGVSNRDDTVSEKSYLNRISFLLEHSHYVFRFSAVDKNSKRTFTWEMDIAGLEPNTLVSDLEISGTVKADSSGSMTKFLRGKTLYRTEPSLIFDKKVSPLAYLYFELYPDAEQIGNSQLMVLTLERDGEIVSDDYIDFAPLYSIEGITLKVPLTDKANGRYDGLLQIQLGEQSVERSFELYVTETVETVYGLFPNPEDDLFVLRYYSGNQAPADWKNYSPETKKQYLSQMWRMMARSLGVQTADLINNVRERVDYSNRFFGSLSEGWKSDMGRIYIRNGKPDEIEKDTTADDTRYVRKDYQIWKYRGRINAVYVFVDMQMSGKYQLVYVDNDSMERSYPDYLRYLGDDFDTSRLRN